MCDCRNRSNARKRFAKMKPGMDFINKRDKCAADIREVEIEIYKVN